MDTVVSPCISVCMLNPDNGYCQGCWRTASEISSWARISDEKRLEILDALHERREEAGFPVRRRPRRKNREQQ